MRAPVLALAFAVIGTPLAAQECPAPRKLDFTVTGEIHRSDLGFTEGLEIYNGELLESTGDVFGETGLNRIDRRTGKVTVLRNDHHNFFGEGITVFAGRLYQMSWREHKVFVYDLEGKPTGQMHNPREGWGLTHDGSRLIASDGSSKLFFLSPKDFSTQGSVTVRLGNGEIANLNELEYADGAVWANVFEDWHVLRIAPSTGCVTAIADLHPLYERLSFADRTVVDSDSNFVLNGIAHDPASGEFILTGKFWPVLFTGRFVEK